MSRGDTSLGAAECPFCGAQPKRELRRLGSVRAASYAVVCGKCRAVGPLTSPALSAIAAWNKAKLPEPCGRCELDRDGFGFDGMLPAHTCERSSVAPVTGSAKKRELVSAPAGETKGGGV